MQSNPVPAHSLTLTGRSTATLTGVEDVDCFNEQIVVLRTGGELRAHLANRKVIAPGNHDHEDQAWHKENKQNRREAHPSGRRGGVDAV